MNFLPEERERWGGRVYFLFAALGSAIGLGNLWRFPYMAYEHGGGAFIIAWLISLVALGIPWLIMEFGLGHYFQKSAPGALGGIHKRWEWLGWWAVFMAFLIVTYYTVIIAWSLRYVISSASMAWGTGAAGAAAAGDFFYGTVLNLSGGPVELGAIQWLTVGLLALTWIIMFFIMFRGAGVIGKVAVWTVSIPWVLVVILLVRGLTLEGAVDGLNYYLNPDFSELTNPDLWFAALSQIAFTLSVGMAGMYAYGSFVPKKGDITNNAFITGFANCATSFVIGFAVFSTLGYLAFATNAAVPEVAQQSLGLAFEAFPAAIAMFPGGNAAIGVIFFLCVAFLGIDSAFFLAHAAVAAPLRDKFGWSLSKSTAIVCVAAFLIGILYCTQGGLYWLDLIDRAAAFYGLLITGALSAIVVGWFYRTRELRDHLNAVSDIRLGAWWEWVIRILLPVGLLFVVIYGGFMSDVPAAYGGYSLGPLNGSHVIWIVLGVTLIASFILQSFKGKSERR